MSDQSSKLNPLKRWINFRVLTNINLVYLAIGIVGIPLAWVLAAVGARLIGLMGLALPEEHVEKLLGNFVGDNFVVSIFRAWLAMQIMALASGALVLLDIVHRQVHLYAHQIESMGFAQDTIGLAKRLHERPVEEMLLLGYGSHVLRWVLVLAGGIAAVIATSGFSTIAAWQAFAGGCLLAWVGSPDNAVTRVTDGFPGLLAFLGLIAIAVVGAPAVPLIALSAVGLVKVSHLETGCTLTVIDGKESVEHLHEDTGGARGFYGRQAVSPLCRLAEIAENGGTWWKTKHALTLATAREQLQDPDDWTDRPISGQVVRGARIDGDALLAELRMQRR